MIRLPDNRTCVESSLLKVMIEAGLWENVNLVSGYGPSYGVDDRSKEILGQNGEITSNMAPVTLVGVWHRAEVGPVTVHYWWLEITVKEFAVRDSSAKVIRGIDNQGMREYLYANRFRYPLPVALTKYIEEKQAQADQLQALNSFAEAAGFVLCGTDGAYYYEHPEYHIILDRSPSLSFIEGLELPANHVRKGDAFYDHFVATGEILPELICEGGYAFKTPVQRIQITKPAELAYLNALQRTVYNGVEYVDMYGRWRALRAAPQQDTAPEGYSYLSSFGNGDWYSSGSKVPLTWAWKQALMGEISLRVNGHLPGEYELQLEGCRVRYTVLDAAQGNVRVDSLQPFEGLEAADDFLSNRSGRPTQAETRKQVRDAKSVI